MKEFRRLAIPPEAIARAIAFAIKQPGDADVNEIIVRSTASPYQLVACAGRNNHYAKWCATRSEGHMILHILILTLFAAFAAVLLLAAGAVFGPAAVAQTAAPAHVSFPGIGRLRADEGYQWIPIPYVNDAYNAK
jgi:hypothetical protein